MGRFRFLSVVLFCAAALCCSQVKTGFEYKGTIDLAKHEHLKGKKIFIDPGHGARAKLDGRIGPTGLTEEEINLHVGTILASMLTTAGAEVKMSRTADVDISLDERVKMVQDFKPDLFISIHHNGNPRPKDKVNFPSILIWGSKDENPASCDFAELLLPEFNKLFEQKGIIVSDYSYFRETGTKVLRETRGVCPGILGEFGFFSDRDEEALLRKESYLIKEAEAYFTGISEYIKRGIPTAVLLADQRTPDTLDSSLGLSNRHPRLFIRVDSGTKQKGIAPGSLKVTLNDLSVPTSQINDNTFEIQYGSLFAGGHKIRFSFRNPRNQSSMILYGSLVAGFAKGEFLSNLETGKSMIASGNVREGIQRLLPALYEGSTDPLSDSATLLVAQGFEKLGDKPMAAYYYASLWQFFPESTLRNSVPPQYRLRHIQGDFYGKKVKWERF